MKLTHIIGTAIATLGLCFTAQAASVGPSMAAHTDGAPLLIEIRHGGHHGGGIHHGGAGRPGHMGFAPRHFSSGHWNGRPMGGLHFRHLGASHWNRRPIGGGHWSVRRWGYHRGHWRGRGYRWGRPYYGWAGGSCYSNCLAAGFSPAYCSVYSYNFCW